MENNALHILVVSSHSETTSQLQYIFATEKEYYVQFTKTCQEALQVAARDMSDIGVVLVDEAISDASSLETVRKLAIVTPSTPIVALAEQSAVTYVREALLAGARAFITKPLRDSDVISTLNQLVQMENLRNEKRSRSDSSDVKQKCEVITVMSPKGGVGCTTIAMNLAVALREKTQQRVVLVDGHSSLGDLETVLNLQVQFNCRDILRNGENIDFDLVTGVLANHTSGVQILASSRELEDIDHMNVDTFEKIVYYLSRTADYVIIDAGTIFEEQTSVSLSVADRVILLTVPEITALHRTVLFLKAAEQNDFPQEKLMLVVNRDGLASGLSIEDISQHLKMQIAGTLPDDPALVVYSLNRGIPLVTSNPRSALARRIHRVADQLLPRPGEEDGKVDVSGNLFGRLTTMLRGNPV